MMRAMLNAQRGAAIQAGQARATTRLGTVTSYDPDAYAAKVTLQPDGIETGWIPLKTVWAGNGWGLFCPPSIGDLVELDFQEGDTGVGAAGLRFYNDQDRPLPCPSGELWLVHQSGSVLKFLNDGTVHIEAKAGITSKAPRWQHDGDITVTGGITATGDVVGSGVSLAGHIHSKVTPGGGKSGGPVK